MSDVLSVANAAAEAMAREGAGREAAELRAVSDEARETAENPSLERIEKTLNDLSARFDEESKKRDQDNNQMLMLTLFLFFLSVYLALFLWWVQALRPGAMGSPPGKPTASAVGPS